MQIFSEQSRKTYLITQSAISAIGALVCAKSLVNYKEQEFSSEIIWSISFLVLVMIAVLLRIAYVAANKRIASYEDERFLENDALSFKYAAYTTIIFLIGMSFTDLADRPYKGVFVSIIAFIVAIRSAAVLALDMRE